MKTPICDFVREYAESDISRLHMPGHKGKPILGCEALDITEIKGADELYAPEGIIAESEENATALFGTGHTFYSTEGSSHCIRAMLCLAGGRFVLAARNAHKAFISAAALLDLEVEWLWPDERNSLCSCRISPSFLEQTLEEMDKKPCAVYVTSPDYLGNLLDIRGLADVCRKRNIPLLVDNAHGAYLHFLSVHPMDLGATACCDSAHKTLPVLTGGAYLHISKDAPESYVKNARSALALFGSTSPSYLTLQSLDMANLYLEGYTEKLMECAQRVESLRANLRKNGWIVPETEPLKLTVQASGLAEKLRQGKVECEYADPDFVVLMFTPENNEIDYQRVIDALGQNVTVHDLVAPNFPKPKRAVSIREAVLSPHETLLIREAIGRICGAPVISCPPAIPIVVSGEVFGEEEVRICEKYRMNTVEVVRL